MEVWHLSSEPEAQISEKRLSWMQLEALLNLCFDISFPTTHLDAWLPAKCVHHTHNYCVFYNVYLHSETLRTSLWSFRLCTIVSSHGFSSDSTCCSQLQYLTDEVAEVMCLCHKLCCLWNCYYSNVVVKGIEVMKEESEEWQMRSGDMKWKNGEGEWERSLKVSDCVVWAL